MQLHKGKRKISDSPPSAIPARLDERANNPENSPSLMRFIRNLFRPSWEIDDDVVDGEEPRKKQKTETPSSARTHTKEVHQRRRRHKRTNSLSSIAQLSGQVVVPPKRLDFSASGLVTQIQHNEARTHASLPLESLEPVASHKAAPNAQAHARRSAGRAHQAASGRHPQSGDNADGPCAAGTASFSGGKRSQQSVVAETDNRAVDMVVRKRQKQTPRHPAEKEKGGGRENGVEEAKKEEEEEEEGKEDESAVPSSGYDASSEDTRAVDEPQGSAATIITSVAPEDPETDHYAQAYDPYEYIRHLPPRSSVSTYERILLPPPKQTKPTLVLDLDETLVHSTIEPPPPGSPPPDHVFSVTLENITYNVFVRVRPNMHQFLAEVAEIFEVVVFTASQEAYAGRLLDMLDTDRHVRYRLYRDSCVFVEGNFVKDLDMLGRDLQRTIIVDNSPLAFAYHLDNGIPIESWFGERADTHLLDLVPFLHQLARAEDVRPLIRDKYASQHRCNAYY